jgi:hypothetical protein
MLHKCLFKYIRSGLTPFLPLLCTLCFSLNTVCGPGSESGYIKIWIWIQFQQIWIQNFNYCERLHAPVQLKELGELSLFKEDTNMSLIRSFFCLYFMLNKNNAHSNSFELIERHIFFNKKFIIEFADLQIFFFVISV